MDCDCDEVKSKNWTVENIIGEIPRSFLKHFQRLHSV